MTWQNCCWSMVPRENERVAEMKLPIHSLASLSFVMTIMDPKALSPCISDKYSPMDIFVDA